MLVARSLAGLTQQERARRASGKSKGLAFVQYADSEAAAAALEALDGTIFQGRLLHVLPAHRPPNQPQPSATPAQVRLRAVLMLSAVPVAQAVPLPARSSALTAHQPLW